MKAKITFIIAAVALLTLSFTFTRVETSKDKTVIVNKTTGSEPVGGFASIEISR